MAKRIDIKDLNIYYGSFHAVADVALSVPPRSVTAFIGPSGCGKSTLLRCLNRMNDLIDDARLEGEVTVKGQDLYGAGVDVIAVRRCVGMVFQKSNPFPKSIYDNVVYGLRITGLRDRATLDAACEKSLRRAALWDEVKDKLQTSALALSGGQQQRLCIARAIATEPDVLLMDEPCSAIDPVATRKIEDLMHELKKNYTIAIVTHNLQQAKRVADMTAFLYVDTSAGGRTGYLVEYDTTQTIDLSIKPQIRQGVSIDLTQVAQLVRFRGPFTAPTVGVDAKCSVEAPEESLNWNVTTSPTGSGSASSSSTPR